MRMAGVCVLVTLALLADTQPAMGEDWLSVRGGPGQNTLRAFDPGNDFRQAWQSAVVSPTRPECVVKAADRLFSVVTSDDDPSLVRLAAFSAVDGSELWTTGLFPKGPPTCPATDGSRVYVGSGYLASPLAHPALAAYSAADGQELWRHTFGPDGGYGSLQGSPTVLDGHVYVQAQDGTCGIYAGGVSGCTFGFDATNGTLLSRTAVSSRAGAASVAGHPVIEVGVAIGRNPEISQSQGNYHLVARRLADGTIAWRDDSEIAGSPIAADAVVYYIREPAWPYDGARVVVARNASTGTVLWTHDLAAGQYASEIVVAASAVYVAVSYQDGQVPGRLIALNRATGAQTWSSASASSGGPHGLYALGDKVYANRQVFSSTGGRTVTDLPEGAAPNSGAAYADGTFYFWQTINAGPARLVAYRDISAPNVAVREPADGAYTTSARPTFNWSSSDGPGSGIESQELRVTGAEGSGSLAPDATSWQPSTPLPDGAYSWSLRIQDRLGNNTTTASRRLVVDTTKPSAFELGLPDGAVIRSLADARLRWAPAQDATSGIDRYEIHIDGALRATVLPTACDDTTCTSSALALPDGPHNWAVRAVDRAGHAHLTSQRRIELAIPPRASITAAPALALTGQEIRLDPSASVDDNGTIQRIEWDVDGDGIYESRTLDRTATSARFATPGVHTVSARVVDNAGLEATTSTTVDVRPTPPAGEIGISINNGDIATNDPDVKLTLVWPKYASHALISNDGGFGAQGGTSTVSLAAQLSWTLRSSGAERLPKTAYLRFKGAEAENVNYTDDIILDETIPELSRVASGYASASTRTYADSRDWRARQATARRFRIHVVGTDKASGISKVVFAPTKSKRYSSTIKLRSRTKLGLRKLDKTLTVLASRTPRWVRVIDSAGNPSTWKRL